MLGNGWSVLTNAHLTETDVTPTQPLLTDRNNTV